MFNMTIKLNPCENIYTLFIPVHLPNIEIKKTNDVRHLENLSRTTSLPNSSGSSWFSGNEEPGMLLATRSHQIPPLMCGICPKHPWNMSKLIEIQKVSHRVVAENQFFQSIWDNFLMYLWVAQAWQILKSVRQLCSSLAFSGSRTLASVSRASNAQLSGFRMISTWFKAIECYSSKANLAKVTSNRNRNQL